MHSNNHLLRNTTGIPKYRIGSEFSQTSRMTASQQFVKYFKILNKNLEHNTTLILTIDFFSTERSTESLTRC